MKYIIDTHTHTISSGHAYSTLAENVRSAAKKGMKLIGITDHAPAMPGSVNGIYFANFGIIPKVIDGVEIMMGAELNILDYEGTVDLSEKLLSSLDLVIASLHPPCLEFGTKEENTNTIICAMENPNIDIIGHPGDPRYPIDVKAIVDASKRTGTLIEINNSSLIPNGIRKGSEVYIGEILRLCKKISMPVILGSDAHFCSLIGNFSNIEKILYEVDFPKELVLNTDIDDFKKFLKK